MSDAVFDRLIGEYAERTGGMAGVGFDRGEPLLDLRLEEKIKRIHDAGIVDIIVTTNGVFLTPERSRKLIEAGLTKLHVSLDAATQETYTLCRGGDLAAVERNVKDFIRLRDATGRKYPLVRVSYAMIVLNSHEHELFVEKWLPHVDYIEFQESADQSRLDNLVDFETEPFYCHYPFQNVSVTAKGEILPCCSFYAKHLVFGNLNDGDTLHGVFNDPRTERLRQSFLGKASIDIVCRNCRFKPPGAPENCEILVPPSALKLKRGPRARE